MTIFVLCRYTTHKKANLAELIKNIKLKISLTKTLIKWQ
jgi:hypothetical protein